MNTIILTLESIINLTKEVLLVPRQLSGEDVLPDFMLDLTGIL
ncbi:hypothetical protein [Lyngbya aestuarii]